MKVYVLQQVVKGNSLYYVVDEGSSQGEVWVVFDFLQGSCDDWDIVKFGIFESFVQQIDVIGGMVYVVGLSKEKGGVIKVVFVGFQC